MPYYRKKALQKLIPWTPDLPMCLVSVSEADKLNGSPQEGDMIASNPKNPEDMWLVAKQFFEDNYDYVGDSETEQKKLMSELDKDYNEAGENAELRARVGRLEERLKAVLDSIDPYFENDEYMDCLKVLNETPQQSLAEIEQEKTNE